MDGGKALSEMVMAVWANFLKKDLLKKGRWSPGCVVKRGVELHLKVYETIVSVTSHLATRVVLNYPLAGGRFRQERKTEEKER